MIIVPNVLSSLVTLHNVKDLLEDGRQVCVRGVGGRFESSPFFTHTVWCFTMVGRSFTAENDPHQKYIVFSSVRRDCRVPCAVSFAREHSGNCP